MSVAVGTESPDPAPASPRAAGPGAGQSPERQRPGEAAVESPRAVLDGYLDALAAEDFDRAVALSAGGPQLVALVRGIVHAHNEQAGGRTSLEWRRRDLSLAAESAGEARFGGEAHLHSMVSGPAAPSREATDRFADVVLTITTGGWRVTDLQLDGRPVVDHAPADRAAATATVGGVRLRLVGAVAFGNVVGAIVELVADGDHQVAVDAARLRVGDEEAPAGDTLLAGGQPGWAYTTFARRDDRPTEWRALVSVDGTPAQELVLRF